MSFSFVKNAHKSQKVTDVTRIHNRFYLLLSEMCERIRKELLSDFYVVGKKKPTTKNTLKF